MVEEFRVVVFPYHALDREPVYPIQVELWDGHWAAIECWTRADERRYPKRAAAVGASLVEGLKGLFGKDGGT
jgi:hypothetical protein